MEASGAGYFSLAAPRDSRDSIKPSRAIVRTWLVALLLEQDRSLQGMSLEHQVRGRHHAQAHIRLLSGVVLPFDIEPQSDHCRARARRLGNVLEQGPEHALAP